MSVEIRVATSANDIAAVRQLWQELWKDLGFAPDFDNFNAERDALPGSYASPRGILLLARGNGKPAATIACRPCGDLECEAKRLYVGVDFRGEGIAKELFQCLIELARGLGYQRMRGHTAEPLTKARRLYAELGFVERAPYAPRNEPGVIGLLLDLNGNQIGQSILCR